MSVSFKNEVKVETKKFHRSVRTCSTVLVGQTTRVIINKTRNSHQNLGHLDQTLSCSIPLQIGMLFDVEVCSSLAIYIVLHMISRVVFDRKRFSMLFVVLFRLPTYLQLNRATIPGMRILGLV